MSSAKIPTPIVDKNGKKTTVHRKADDGANGAARSIPAVSAPRETVKVNTNGLITLATIDSIETIFSGNGFNNETVRPDGTFDGNRKDEHNGWYTQKFNGQINQEAVETLISQGLLEIETTDIGGILRKHHELKVTDAGRESIEASIDGVKYEDGTPVGHWMEIYSYVIDPLARTKKIANYNNSGVVIPD